MEEVIAKVETWIADEEEEEDEMVSLKRNSKPPPPSSPQVEDNGNGNDSPLVVENQNGEEQVMVEGVAVEIDSPLQLQQPEVVDEKQVEENRSESEKSSNNSIYLDEQTGGKSSNGINQMAFSAQGNSVTEIQSELSTGESIATLNGDEIQKTLTNGKNHQTLEILEDEAPSGLTILLNGNSSENGVADAKHVEIHEPLRLLKEDKQEVAEWDVERVIEEQETHDLYCPNCNSCITKRVILRKRKRQIKTLQYDVKREKIEKAVKYPSSATNDPDHNITEVDSLSAPPDLGANVRDPDNAPGVFRCLECFSFFFQTVSGFKIFRSFRKSDAGESEQISEQILARNTVEQGDDDIQRMEKDAAEEMNSVQYITQQKNDIISSVIPVPNKPLIQYANGSTVVPSHERDDLIESSTLASAPVKEMKDGVEENQKVKIITTPEVENSQLPYQEGNQFTNSYPLGKPGESQEDGGSIHYFSKLQPLQTGGQDKLVDAAGEINSGAVENSQLQYQEGNKFTNSYPLGKPGEPQEDGGSIHYFSKLQSVQAGGQDKLANAAGEMNSVGKISGRTQLLPDSHVSDQVKVSAVELWEDQQNLEVSSEQASKQLVGIQINTEGKLGVASKMTDIGKVVMQTYSTVELLKSLSQLEKNVQHETSIAIPKVSGTQLIESKEALPPQEVRVDIEKYINTSADQDTLGVPQPVQDNIVPAIPETMPVFRDQRANEPGSNQWDIMKSIVYGGLMESITSLSVVSSAAGGDAKTLNIVALGLANLVGGLFVLAHGLRDLKIEEYGGAVDKYQEVLGQRRNFWSHATVAVISYLVFGSVPPVTYGFSFYKSDNREYKLIAVAAASLFCIILLALGKAYTRTKNYIKTVLYFSIMGIMASGLCYVVGVLVDMLLEKLGLFESSTVVTVPPSSAFFETLATKPSWASY